MRRRQEGVRPSLLEWVCHWLLNQLSAAVQLQLGNGRKCVIPVVNTTRRCCYRRLKRDGQGMHAGVAVRRRIDHRRQCGETAGQQEGD
jgi:hypothetical protein